MQRILLYSGWYVSAWSLAHLAALSHQAIRRCSPTQSILFLSSRRPARSSETVCYPATDHLLGVRQSTRPQRAVGTPVAMHDSDEIIAVHDQAHLRARSGWLISVGARTVPAYDRLVFSRLHPLPYPSVIEDPAYTRLVEIDTLGRFEREWRTPWMLPRHSLTRHAAISSCDLTLPELADIEASLVHLWPRLPADTIGSRLMGVIEQGLAFIDDGAGTEDDLRAELERELAIIAAES